MSETQPTVTIEQATQSVAEPTVNKLGFENAYHKAGLITKPSLVAVQTEENLQRPLALRSVRAELFKEAYRLYKENKNSSPGYKERKTSLRQEAEARDEIAQQYLKQGEVRVTLPGLGVQTARYVDIKPPESQITPETEQLPPILFIPGISNDIDAVGSITQEIPMTGRRVITVAFPESFMGTVTPEFADAVAESDGFGPHVEFYKAVVDGFMNQLPQKETTEENQSNAQMELWGFSTGAEVVARLLQDPAMQDKVSHAVLLNPASSTDMTHNKLMYGGGFGEIKHVIRNFRLLPRYTFTAGRLPQVQPEAAGQRKLKEKVYNTILERVRTNFKSWETARVREGGNIIVVSGKKDKFTRSYDTFNDKPGTAEKVASINPQVQIVDMPNGAHMSPLLRPVEYLQKIYEAQKQS